MSSPRIQPDALMPEKIDDEIKRLNLIVTATQMRRIDQWRGEQVHPPNVSEAIRQLLDLGLDNPAGRHKARRDHKAAR